MLINFFQDCCKTESNKLEFGLCDDIDNPHAYIDEFDNKRWIGIVENPDGKKIEFFAIDNCIEIKKPNGTDQSTCDGVLKENSNLIFIELKERKTGKSRWFKKGREQLTSTIEVFKQNNDISNYTSVKAFICNKLRPLSHSGKAANIQKFYDDTGFILKDQQKITI